MAHRVEPGQNDRSFRLVRPDRNFDDILFDNQMMGLLGVHSEFISHEDLEKAGSVEDPLSPFKGYDSTATKAPTQTLLVAREEAPNQADPDAPAEATRRSTTFTLNPFSLVLSGIKIPLIGFVELSVRKVKHGIRIWYSFIYKQMGMLSAKVRLDVLGISSEVTHTYNKSPAAWMPCPTCRMLLNHTPNALTNSMGQPSIADMCLCHFRAVAPRHPEIFPQVMPFALMNPNVMGLNMDCTSLIPDSRSMIEEFTGGMTTFTNDDVCRHAQEGDVEVKFNRESLSPGFDGMLFVPPAKRHRAGLHYNGYRCTVCYTSELHGLHPKFVKGMAYAHWDSVPPILKVVFHVIFDLWKAFTYNLLAIADDWDLMACSPERAPEFHGLKKHIIIIVDNLSYGTALVNQYQSKDRIIKLFLVPKFGSGRFLSGWRWLLSQSTTAPIKFLIVNALSEGRWLYDLEQLRAIDVDGTSMATGHFWPCYMGAFRVVCPSSRKFSLQNACASFMFGGHVYGWDEVYPTLVAKPIVVTAGKSRPPGICTPIIDPDISASYKIAVMYSPRSQVNPVVHVTGLRRGTIFYLKRYYDNWNPFDKLGFFDVLFDPRPIMLMNKSSQDTMWEVSSPEAQSIVYATDPVTNPYDDIELTDQKGEHVLQELTQSLGGIWINTFGTYGDVVPLVGIMRYLRSWGAMAFVQQLNTEEEGHILVKEALGESEQDKTTATNIYHRARSHVLGQNRGLHWSPANLHLPGLTYSLKPPSDVIRFFVPTGKLILNLLYSVMSVFLPEPVYIGAYWRPGWLPRSADGEQFLRNVQNTQEIEMLAAWGVDKEAPPGWKHIPVVTPGDHVSQFSKAKIVVCHGGAGTVQTAAACGARVISVGKKLDRAYRDPYDAGIGVNAGAPPDRIFLALARADIRFFAIWLKRNWTSPWQLISWFGAAPIGYLLFRLLMLFMIYSREHRQTIVSTDPMVTLLLVLLRSKPSFLMMTGVYFAAKGIDRILDAANIGYGTIIRHFLAANWRLSASFVGIWLSQRYNLAWGLLWSYVGPMISDLTDLVSSSLSATIVGPPNPTDHTVYLEYSIAWRGPIWFFHTALICNGERYEGGAVADGELYKFQVKKGDRRPNSFIIPTALGWDRIRKLPHITGRYSAAWNCQTGLVIQLKNYLPALGAGGLALIATSVLASGVYTAIAAVMYVYIGMTAIIPQNVGLSATSESGVDSLMARVMQDLTHTLMDGTGWSFIEILEWWRSLYMPFSAGINDDKVLSVTHAFEELPLLYKGDEETMDRYARSLGRLVNEGFSAARITLAIAHIYSYSDETTENGQMYQARVREIRQEILNDKAYINVVHGVAGSNPDEVRSRWLPQVPGTLFDEIVGKSFTQLTVSAIALSLTEKKALYPILEDLQNFIDEMSPLQQFPSLLTKYVSEMKKKAHNTSIILLLLIVGGTGETLPSNMKIPECPYPIVLALRKGFQEHLCEIDDSPMYSLWYENTKKMISSFNDDVLKAVFISHFWEPSVDTPMVFDMDSLLDDPIVEIVSSAVVAVKELGAHDHIIENMMMIATGALLKASEPDPGLEKNLRSWLFKIYLDHGVSMKSFPEKISEYLVSVRKFCETWSLPFSSLNSFVNLLAAIGIGAYDVLDKFIELLVGVFSSINNFTLNVLQEYLYLGRAFLSLLLPEHRRRPKAAWALLFANDFTRLTPNEKFLLSCKMMEKPPENQDYYTWAQAVIEELDRTGLADMKLDLTDPIRPVRLPDAPTTVDEELLKLAPLAPGKAHTADVYRPFVEKWVQSGVPQGMTGVWFSTPDIAAKNIMRYDCPRPQEDDETKHIILRAADALADHYPDLYHDGKFMTPSQVWRNLKIKYSPGLPFVPTFRSRKDLVNHGFLKAMVKAIENRLIEGVNPGTMAHAFVKDDVVSLQKMLDKQKVRYVVAQDLLGNIMKWCTTLYATRRVPPVEAWVMNMVPHTEGGYRPFYNAVKLRETIIQADAREFDSKIGQVITVDGLVHLRSRAYDNAIGKDIIDSQLRSVYLAMRNCKIRDLQYGREFGHNGGLMTGQSDTSQDNKDSFRIMIIASWSAVTGKDPNDFWIYNTLGNAGDDNVWGSDESRETLLKALEWIKEKVGVTVELETEGWENIDLTGLCILPVPESSIVYYRELGMPIPDYAIGTVRERLLAKKTEFKINNSRFSGVSFYMHHIDSLVGSAWLTSHQPAVYRELWEAYRAEAMYVLNRFFTKVEVIEEYNDLGELIGCTLIPGPERQRYLGKTKTIRAWLKNHKFPSYKDLFAVWVKPVDIAQSRSLKTSNRIISWVPSIPILDRITYGFMGVREFLYTHIPNHVVRSLPSFAGEEVSYIMRNQDYTIAKFVWLSLYHKHKMIPSGAALRTALRENPYGSAEDPIGFLDWLSNSNNLDELVKEDLEAYRGKMMTITLIYAFIETIFKNVSRVPGLGWLIHLFALSTRDVNRIYASLNFLYMISEGRSSAVISNMMPNDPYAWIKQFSVILANCVPTRWHKYPGLKHIVKVLPMIVETWAAANIATAPRIFNTIMNYIPPPPQWSSVAQAVDRFLISDHKSFLVIAPTATGKSTAFLGHLFKAPRRFKTLWLLCPTNVAVQGYDNRFVQGNIVQKLAHGVPNQEEQTLKVLTYGHFIQRAMNGEVHETDLLIFDEMHIGQPEMHLAFLMHPNHRKIMITATPSILMPNTYDRVARYEGVRMFNTKANFTKMDFVSLWQFLSAERPDKIKRALIVCPTLTRVNEIRTTLNHMSVVTSELSSDFPVAAKTGVIVATTIVDTAVTIDPPPDTLIDLGEELEITLSKELSLIPKWESQVVPTTPSTHTQRLGRVGRLGDAQSYHMGNPGSRNPKPLVPNPFSLLSYGIYESELSAIYNIRLMVSPVNQATGIIRYARVNPTIGLASTHELTIAGCYYVFAWLSAGLTLQNVTNQWYNHRLMQAKETIEGIVIDDIMSLGLGDPLKANIEASIDALMAGILEVNLNGNFVPATCLVVRDGLILPPQIDPSSYISKGGIALENPYVGPRYSLDRMSLTDFHIQLVQTMDVNIDIFSEPPTIHEFSNVTDITPPPFVPKSSGVLNHILALLTINVRNIIRDFKRVQIIIDDDDIVPLPFPTYHLIVTPHTLARPGLETLTLTNLALGENISKQSIFLIIASCFPDDTYLFYGNFFPQTIRYLDRMRFGLITYQQPNEFDSMIVHSDYARMFAQQLLSANLIGKGDQYIRSLPRYHWVMDKASEVASNGRLKLFSFENHKLIYL